MTANERFMEKVDLRTGDECWLWTGSVGTYERGGYGQFWDGKRCVRAHRYSYEMFVGPIPEGAFVLHYCDVRACVNPQHLHVGDASRNMQERSERNPTWHPNGRKTHCKHGHEFTPENTYHDGKKRYCRTCVRERDRRRRAIKGDSPEPSFINFNPEED
jgi:HNH endonuclease